MTKIEVSQRSPPSTELFAKSADGLREIVRAVMQEMLEAEMTDALAAGKGERTGARLGYRSGYYARTLVTRVGKLELQRAAGSRRPVLDRTVRTLLALRAGVGRDAGRDVRACRLDPKGEGDHRGAVRPFLLGPRPSPLSTSGWTRASTPLPTAPSPSPFPIPDPRRPLYQRLFWLTHVGDSHRGGFSDSFGAGDSRHAISGQIAR